MRKKRKKPLQHRQDIRRVFCPICGCLAGPVSITLWNAMFNYQKRLFCRRCTTRAKLMVSRVTSFTPFEIDSFFDTFEKKPVLNFDWTKEGF
jgi:transcription elongation factor Elf1